MRRWWVLLFILIPLAYNTPGYTANAQGIHTSASASVLMDVDSKRVLSGENLHAPLPMASTTKIMTAVVALALGDPQEMVTIPAQAVGIEGSSMYLVEGETMTLESLLYGLMLRSGNDAAIAIALHISGDVEGFVQEMNRIAWELGATQTNFCNPHGLPAQGHITTAYDLGLIACYAMEDPRFAAIVSAKSQAIQTSRGRRVLYNKNKLLTSMPGAVGIKTGFTREAVRCFVGAALKDDMMLVGVVLNDGPMFEDCRRMLEHGFATYEREEAPLPEPIQTYLGLQGITANPLLPLKHEESVSWLLLTHPSAEVVGGLSIMTMLAGFDDGGVLPWPGLEDNGMHFRQAAYSP